MSIVTFVITHLVRDADTKAIVDAFSRVLAVDFDEEDPVPFLWKYGECFPGGRLAVTDDTPIDVTKATKMLEARSDVSKDGLRPLAHALSEIHTYLVHLRDRTLKDCPGTMWTPGDDEMTLVHVIVDNEHKPTKHDVSIIDFLVANAGDVGDAFNHVNSDNEDDDKSDSEDDADDKENKPAVKKAKK